MYEQEYAEAIRSRVCSVCIDGIFDNNRRFVRCGLPQDRTCPVELYLPDVIEIVESMESNRLEDYVAQLRHRVCPRCEQDEDGNCELRIRADCALDRYFILVAGAIETVRAHRLGA